MIDRRVRMLLKALEDGRWHERLPQRELTTKLVEACFNQGLIWRKLTKIPGKPGHFRGHFAITSSGRKALEKGEHPTRGEIGFTMKYGA